MKYIVIILLLSTNGIEEVRLKHHGNCDGIAEAWVDVNMNTMMKEIMILNFKDGTTPMVSYY